MCAMYSGQRSRNTDLQRNGVWCVVFQYRREVLRQQLFAVHLGLRLEHGRRHHTACPRRLTLAVRNHAGNLALAIDVTKLSEISFKVPVCLSGNIQLQTKTLTATVFFDGPSSAGDQYYMQTSVPAPMTNAYLINKPLSANAYITYSAPMSMSQFANTATDVVFQIGSFGEQFTGTIWVDDIKIQ